MDMAESHVVSALISKGAEIASMIARTQQQLGQFRADLAHVDATVRLFAPAMVPETIPAKRTHQSDLLFECGELSRRVLDALRGAGAPIRAPDLVRAVMMDNGLDPADGASFARVRWKGFSCPDIQKVVGRTAPALTASRCAIMVAAARHNEGNRPPHQF